jgi:hypothetical protein
MYKHINDFRFGYDPDIHTPEFMVQTNNLEGIKWIMKHKKWSKNNLDSAVKWAF